MALALDLALLALAAIAAIGLLGAGIVLGFFLYDRYDDVRRNRQALGTALKVEQRLFPGVYAAVQAACSSLGVPLAPAYIVHDPYMNSGVLPVGWRASVLILNSALVENLTSGELACIVGHELTHLNPGLFGRIERRLRPAGRRRHAAELVCDIGGLIACGDLDTAIRAQLKQVFGKDYVDRLSLSDFRGNLRALYEDPASRHIERFSSHPDVYRRIDNLAAAYGSDEFRALKEELGRKE